MKIILRRSNLTVCWSSRSLIISLIFIFVDAEISSFCDSISSRHKFRLIFNKWFYHLDHVAPATSVFDLYDLHLIASLNRSDLSGTSLVTSSQQQLPPPLPDDVFNDVITRSHPERSLTCFAASEAHWRRIWVICRSWFSSNFFWSSSWSRLIFSKAIISSKESLKYSVDRKWWSSWCKKKQEEVAGRRCRKKLED